MIKKIMICQSPRCDNETKGNRKHCSTCRWRKWKENNPFKYHYYNLRNRAKQRGKSFNLTVEEFKKLWESHPKKWEAKKNPDITCPWQIDRKENDKGYYFENLQIISAEDNIEKWHQQDKQYIEDLNEEAPF